MKATIDGIEVEGTPKELAEFIRGANPRDVDVKQKTQQQQPATQLQKKRKTRKGGMRFKPWTVEEEKYVRDNYVALGPARVAKALRRTHGAVKVHACGMGIRRFSAQQNQKHKVFPLGMKEWSIEELDALHHSKQLLLNRETRRNTIRALAQKFNRTPKAVVIRCNMLGISLYSGKSKRV
jgi:hypothetical protein